MEAPVNAPGTAHADETALLAGLRAGDDAAFEQLLRTHGGRMLAVARRFVHNEEDARDVVQDAFLAAFKGVDRFEGHSQLGTWLHRIVVNTALQKVRSRERKPEQSIEALLPTFVDDGHHTHATGPWHDSVTGALERGETQALVRAAIDRLPETYRTVLLLRDIEGLDNDETARLLGLNVAAVKSRLHRARQALRTLLHPHFARENV